MYVCFKFNYYHVEKSGYLAKKKNVFFFLDVNLVVVDVVVVYYVYRPLGGS